MDLLYFCGREQKHLKDLDQCITDAKTISNVLKQDTPDKILKAMSDWNISISPKNISVDKEAIKEDQKEVPEEEEALARALDVSTATTAALLDLVEKKKIPKPEKLFKDNVPKLNRKVKYPFTFLDLGQRQYFLLGDHIPLGNALKKALLEANKQLKKAKITHNNV